MENYFKKLSTVIFSHEYFAGRKFEGLTITIPSRTAGTMQKNDLLVKREADRFHIFYNSKTELPERPVSKLLTGSIQLTFHVWLEDIDFYNYTGINIEDMGRSYFLFHNRHKNSMQKKDPSYLHSDDLAGEKAITNELLPGMGMDKPFAIIRLRLDETLAENFSIRFPVRKTYWQYILASDYLKQLENPFIEDSAGKELFEGPVDVVLPNSKTAFLFRSKNLIALSATVNQRFQLMDKHDEQSKKAAVILKQLPLPKPSLISALEPGGAVANRSVSNIFLY